jgi:large subunit ribosomal protein L19
MNATAIRISPVNMEARKKLDIKAGDTVRVHQKIVEKGKTRTQMFEGLVLARKHGTEPGATFTVRRVASGVGVEKIFPLYSPMIEIEIVKRAKVRRAKLYYIRTKVAKEIRRQMRKSTMVGASTMDAGPEEVPAKASEPETPEATEQEVPEASESAAEEISSEAPAETPDAAPAEAEASEPEGEQKE